MTTPDLAQLAELCVTAVPATSRTTEAEFEKSITDLTQKLSPGPVQTSWNRYSMLEGTRFVSHRILSVFVTLSQSIDLGLFSVDNPTVILELVDPPLAPATGALSSSAGSISAGSMVTPPEAGLLAPAAPASPPSSGLTLENATVSVNLKSLSWSLSADIAGKVPLLPGLVLDEIAIDARMQQTTLVSGSLRATLTIGSLVSFEIVGQKTGEQIFLSGETDAAFSVDALVKQVDADAALPDGLPSLTVKQLRIAYTATTGTTIYDFQLEVDGRLSLVGDIAFDGFSLQLTRVVSNGQASTTISVAGRFELGAGVLLVKATHAPNGWSLYVGSEGAISLQELFQSLGEQVPLMPDAAPPPPASAAAPPAPAAWQSPERSESPPQPSQGAEPTGSPQPSQSAEPSQSAASSPRESAALPPSAPPSTFDVYPSDVVLMGRAKLPSPVDGLTVTVFLSLRTMQLTGSVAPTDKPMPLSGELANFLPQATALPSSTPAAPSPAPVRASNARPASKTDWNITNLVFIREPAGSSFSCSLGDVSLGRGVTLTQASLQSKWGGADSQSSTSIAATCAFGQGEDRVNVTLTATQGSNGWELRGYSGLGEKIKLGALVADLAAKLGVDADDVPAAIRECILENLDVTFNPNQGTFRFKGETQLPVSDKLLDVVMTIERAPAPAAPVPAVPGQSTPTASPTASKAPLQTTFTAEGSLQPRGSSGATSASGKPSQVQFKFDIRSGADGTVVAGSLSSSDGKTISVNLHDLVNGLSSDAAELVPEDLTLDLVDAFIVYRTLSDSAATPPGGPASAAGTAARGMLLVGVDIGFALEFSSLPLVGGQLGNVPAKVRLVYASSPVTPADFTRVSAALPQNIVLPASPISKGLNASTALTLGGQTLSLSSALSPRTPARALPAAPSQAGAQPVPGAGTAITPPPPSPPPSPGSWVDVQKTVDPVTLQRVGVAYADKRLSFMLDADLRVGQLTLGLIGLGLSFPLKPPFTPSPRISGLNISYSSDDVEVTGSFIAGPNMKSFAGEALLRTGTFSLSAIGMYEDAGAYNSAFIFATISAPIGGPPCFFVTGLAAGFGYNSQVQIPPIEGVRSHLLVQAAAPSTPGSSNALGVSNQKKPDPAAILNKLMTGDKDAAVVRKQGDHWLAAGVRFKSFDMIDTMALLVVQFGNELQIDLLGVSSMWLPRPPKNPIAFLEVALRVVVQPARGVFMADALITPASYVLDPACKLRGGFAFYCWYGPNEHAGDFVLTIGGYHPSFRVPAHYPKVERLGFDWPISSSIQISGSSYFALTPSAVMVGGRLSVVGNWGWFGASLVAVMDALVEWAPFHFDLFISVSISVWADLWLFTARATVGVELHLWGPPTGGTVTINLSFVKFTIEFGNKAGKDSPRLPWANGSTGFADTLLPKEILTARVTSGLVSTQKEGTDEVWVVRPDDFRFSVTSAIPVTKIVDAAGNPIPNTKIDDPIQVRPVGIALTDTTLTVRLALKSDNGTAPITLTQHYTLDAARSKLPAAKWGKPVEGMTIDRTTETVDVQIGIAEVRAIEPPLTPSGGALLDVALETIQYKDISFGDRRCSPAVLREWPRSVPVAPASREGAMSAIAKAIGATGDVRAQMIAALSKLGIEPCDAAAAAADPFAGNPGQWLGGAPLLA